MYYQLASGTDVATHYLYDPEAILHLKDREGMEFFDQLHTQETNKGNVLEYYVASDGATMYRIYVDESIPEELKAGACELTKDLLLKVPSGTLVASGAEYVGNPEEIERAVEYSPGASPMVTKVIIPAGNYLVDAYEFDWNWDAVIAPVIKRELGMAHTWEGYFGPGLGCGFIGTFFGACWVLFAWFDQGWSWSLLYWVGVPFALMAVSGFFFWLMIPKEYWKKKDEIAARYSPNVLVMRRLPEGEDLSAYKGGGFGFAYLEESAGNAGK